MVRPRDIGTRAETAVVRFMRDNGFPGADRQPLRGHRDQGDIAVTAGIVAEVKAGAQATNASVGQIRLWLAQTERERHHADADIAVLVLRQRGRGPAAWHVWTTLYQLDSMRGALTDDGPDTSTPLMLLLADWCDLARLNWGDPE